MQSKQRQIDGNLAQSVGRPANPNERNCITLSSHASIHGCWGHVAKPEFGSFGVFTLKSSKFETNYFNTQNQLFIGDKIKIHQGSHH